MIHIVFYHMIRYIVRYCIVAKTFSVKLSFPAGSSSPRSSHSGSPRSSDSRRSHSSLSGSVSAYCFGSSSRLSRSSSVQPSKSSKVCSFYYFLKAFSDLVSYFVLVDVSRKSPVILPPFEIIHRIVLAVVNSAACFTYIGIIQTAETLI